LFDLADKRYTALFKKKAKDACRRTLKYILQKNIIWGDVLDLKTVGPETHQIIFAEWSFPLHNSLIKRRDFIFAELLPGDNTKHVDMFSKNGYVSDLGKRVFLPTETCYYPPVHFLKVSEAYD
jgi:hypothetical protein